MGYLDLQQPLTGGNRSRVEGGEAVTGSRADLARSAVGIATHKGAGKRDTSSPDALKCGLLAAKSRALRRTRVSGVYCPAMLERARHQ